MNANRFLITLLLFFCFTGLVIAGEKTPENPKPKDDGGAAEGEDPPAKEDPPPDKGNAELMKILKKIKNRLAGKDREAQFKAVEELIQFECPADPATVKEISVVLTLAVNKLRGSYRHKCAAKFTEIGRKCPDAGVADKVKAILRMMERSEGKNADVNVCLVFFDYLLSLSDPDAEKIVGGFLGLLNDYQNVFHLLLKYSREGTIEIIANIANDTKNKNLIKRRHATTFLGFWGNGPPLYKIRVPALIKGMKSPVTSAEAIKSLKRICLPDHQKPSRWDRWWKRNEKEGLDDIAIIREDLKDTYERVRGKQKKGEGALAIAEWIREWNSERFKWALPILLNPLMKEAYSDKDLRMRVIAVLGGIGEEAALEDMSKLLKTTKGEKRNERALMGDIIRNMARIAGSAPDSVRQSTGAALAPYLDNLFEGVVEAAAEAMGLLKYKESQVKLIGVMSGGTKPRAALKAAEALGRMQAKKALEPMLNM
ncbi:MAG: HEAT repeat domain-containing protein, partial [Planctomycetota bacterium]